MGTPKGTVPWNAGTGKGWTDNRGYRWVSGTDELGRRRNRREHRVVMERIVGRRLEAWEVVHHKDGNPSNNDPSNLELQEFGAHTARHHTGSRHRYDTTRTLEAFALLRGQLTREREIRADLYAALQALLEDGTLDQALLEPGRVLMARAALAKADGR